MTAAAVETSRSAEPSGDAFRAASVPRLDNDLLDELLISIPGHSDGRGDQRGRIDVWYGQDIMDGPFYGSDKVKSLPAITKNSDCGGTGSCSFNECIRGCYVAEPVNNPIVGESAGDRLGNAHETARFKLLKHILPSVEVECPVSPIL